MEAVLQLVQNERSVSLSYTHTVTG